MPGGWQQGVNLKPENLKGLLVEDLVPAFLRQTYLLGIDLGEAWCGAHGDAAMQQFLNMAINDVQEKLGIRFARQRVVTDPDSDQVLGVDYDLLGERLMYFRPSTTVNHYAIPLPYAHVTSIERVRLFYLEREVFRVPEDWISFTSKEGILRVYPGILSSVVQTTWGGFDMLAFAYGTRDYVPAAWSIDYTFGYGRVDMNVAQYIGLTAAIQVLSMAASGKDLGGGIASESLSMDGTTETIGHVQGKYGPYSGTIQAYKDQLDALDWRQLRLSKKGVKLAAW